MSWSRVQLDETGVGTGITAAGGGGRPESIADQYDMI